MPSCRQGEFCNFLPWQNPNKLRWICFFLQLLERSLRLLFESCDVSKVKAYVQRQFSKIIQNRNSLQDFIFAKEFRGRQGYKPGACVPALEITK